MVLGMPRTFFFNSQTKYSVGNRRWGRIVSRKVETSGIIMTQLSTASKDLKPVVFFPPNVYDAQIDSMWIPWRVRC